jgi:hypothetical protein
MHYRAGPDTGSAVPFLPGKSLGAWYLLLSPQAASLSARVWLALAGLPPVHGSAACLNESSIVALKKRACDAETCSEQR